MKITIIGIFIIICKIIVIIASGIIFSTNHCHSEWL